MTIDISKFDHWIEAWKYFYDIELQQVPLDPNAVLISSVNEKGVPNARVVLVKDVGDDGFVFYTNYESQKGKELFHNSHGHLTWYSRLQGVSIRAQGKIEKVDPTISDQYFSTRDRNAQISANISKQSQEVESRLVLDNEFKEFEKKFEGKDIPRPSHWGGICLIPSKVEIWKSRDDYLTRLHDRIVFSIDNGVLSKKRLYP
tara:strand:- start:3821 stop:4426 length:606 start_codon:yes stop_codon:yes gene_type:complete